jgi:hypothetical protein
MKKLFVVIIAILTMVAFAGNLMAQAPAKPAEPTKVAPAPEKAKTEKPKTMKATGVVAAYEAGKMIKVKGKDKDMAFDITGDTKVKGEVKEGAKATVMYKKDGDKMIATSISIAAEKKKAPEKK